MSATPAQHQIDIGPASCVSMELTDIYTYTLDGNNSFLKVLMAAVSVDNLERSRTFISDNELMGLYAISLKKITARPEYILFLFCISTLNTSF